MPYARCKTAAGNIHSVYTTKLEAQRMARALNAYNRRLARDGFIVEPIQYIVDILVIREDPPDEGIGVGSPWAYYDSDDNWAVIDDSFFNCKCMNDVDAAAWDGDTHASMGEVNPHSFTKPVRLRPAFLEEESRLFEEE